MGSLKDGGATFTGAVTVGVDDTGKDVKLFGASAGAYALWDESANLLDLRGATAAGPGHLKLTTGELTVVDADVLGKIEFQAPLESDGTDAILVGAAIWAEADDTFAAGVNNTDLVFALGKSETAAEKFRFTADNEIGIAGANYGTDGQVLTSGCAGAACAWEDVSGAVTALNNATQSELVTVGSTTTELDAEANLTFTGSALTCIGTITVGVDNTGHDVKFFGATASSHMLWDESADALNLVASTLGVGAGGTKDLGTGIHIKTADSSASANAGADELVIENNGVAGLSILTSTSTTGTIAFGDSGDNDIGKIEYVHSNNGMQFTTNGTERLRIEDTGEFRFMSQGQSLVDDGAWLFNGLVTGWTFNVFNRVTSGTPSGFKIEFPHHDGPVSYIQYMADDTQARCQIMGDGDLENGNNSYGAISDERIKQDITDATSQWDDIKGLRVRNFKRKDEVRKLGEAAKTQIGLVAQEAEVISPNLIAERKPTRFDIASNSTFGTLHEADVLWTSGDQEVIDGEKEEGVIRYEKGSVKTETATVKSMKYSVLYMKAIKALQEAQTRIETLEAKVAVLEG